MNEPDRLPPFVFHSILIVILAASLVAIFITPPIHDEEMYHVPLARNISPGMTLSGQSSYSSAYPPLPYFFGNQVLRLFPSLESLRLLNLAIFLAAVFVFRSIAVRISYSPDFLTALFVLNPYLIKASFTYLMYNWGILFALAGLYLYFFKPKHAMPPAHLLFGMAVLSQQWLLAVVGAVLLHEVVGFSRKEISHVVFAKLVLQKALFLLPAAFLFWKWRGFVHPNFASHSLHPTFEHLNAVLATLGLALICLVIAHWKRILCLRNTVLIFLLPLLWVAIPEHSFAHGPSVMTGITSQLAVKLAVFTGIPYKITMFVFILGGLASLCILLSRKGQGFHQVMVYVLLGLVAAFTLSSRLAASHIFICLPFVWLALSEEITGLGIARYPLLAQFSLLSVTYWIYIVFFRSRGFMF